MKTINEFLKGSMIINNEWVDLGLSDGTLWCSHNLGAKTSEEIGDYYMWGSN